jgi:hypothetical protein
MTSPIEIKVDLEGDELGGTGNLFYDVIWFIQECMTNDRRLTGFVKDAEGNTELEEFFEDVRSKNEASWDSAVLTLRTMLKA